MVNIQVRGVPEAVHSVLTQRADAEGQSLQAYLLALLTDHAGRRSVAEILADVEDDLASNPDAYRSTTDEITEAFRRDRASH